jgi:5-methylcytosine-specific restriction endonuclease McrA
MGNELGGERKRVFRTFRKKIRSLAVEELRQLFDWSLPGRRIYGLKEKDRFYLVADVLLETPQGRMTTRLQTPGVREALSKGQVIHCFQAWITVPGNYDRRTWQRLRREVFKRDGRRCKRCGTGSNLQVDHIKPWRDFPELRYDADNLQVLCRTCHELKGKSTKLRVNH